MSIELPKEAIDRAKPFRHIPEVFNKKLNHFSIGPVLSRQKAFRRKNYFTIEIRLSHYGNLNNPDVKHISNIIKASKNATKVKIAIKIDTLISVNLFKILGKAFLKLKALKLIQIDSIVEYGTCPVFPATQIIKNISSKQLQILGANVENQFSLKPLNKELFRLYLAKKKHKYIKNYSHNSSRNLMIPPECIDVNIRNLKNLKDLSALQLQIPSIWHEFEPQYLFSEGHQDKLSIKLWAPQFQKLNSLSVNFSKIQHYDFVISHCLKQLSQLGSRLQKLEVILLGVENFKIHLASCLAKFIDSQRNSLNSLKLNCKRCYQISDESMRYILTSISKHTKLEKLKFDCSYCFNIQELQSFDCSQNLDETLKSIKLNFSKDQKISESSLQHLLQQLGTLKQLSKFSIDFLSLSALTDVGIDMVSQIIENNVSTLSKLQLGFNSCVQITEAPMDRLTEAIKKLELVSFTFQFYECSSITNFTILKIGEILEGENMKMLRKLKANFNKCLKIDEIGFSKFVKGFQNLQKLEEMVLYFNHLQFQQEGPIRKLFTQIGKNTELTLIEIQLCYFGSLYDKDLEIFVDSVKKLKNVQILDLGFTSCPNVQRSSLMGVNELLKYCEDFIYLH